MLISFSFVYWFKCFFNNQISDMAKLRFYLSTNLLINKIIAKLLESAYFYWSRRVLDLKYN